MTIYTSKLFYYVYAYLRKDGTPYYIGKGKRKRAWGNNHSVLVPNDNTKILILEANLTEIGAFALERRMICWYGRKDNGTGILRNRTDGGEGVCGAIFSDETRRRMSLGQKGRIHSEKTKLKMSKAAKGRTFSEKQKLNLIEANSKTWIFVNPNGEKITIKNLAKFCRENNLSRTLMSYVSIGKRKHHKGWIQYVT